MIKSLTCQLVGSYTKPSWLLQHDKIYNLDGAAWRISGENLASAQADVVRLAIYEQERAGIDLISDGEGWRSAWDKHFLTKFDGIDTTNLASQAVPASEIGTVTYKKEGYSKDDAGGLPRVVGAISWSGPISVEELTFARSITDRPIKTQIVGPFTILDRIVDEHYGDELALAMDIAGALNAELKALEAAGAAVLHIDDPVMHSRFSRVKRLGLAPIERLVEGLKRPTTIHVCYGYAYSKLNKEPSPTYAELLRMLADCEPITAMSIEYEQPKHGPELLENCDNKHVVLGLLDLGTHEIETPEHIAARIRAALKVIPAERLHPSSDCGMWHLPRGVAYGKIKSLVMGTDIVRKELGLPTST